MEESKSNILKTDLVYSAKRLSDIISSLPEKLNELKSTDSSGEDEQGIFEIVEGIRMRFLQLSDDLDSPFKIAVVGSQGTGKSTIVNLLLGEALMPSTTLENESAVIRLAYPPEESLLNQAVFELKDGSNEQTSIEEATILIDKVKRKEKDDSFVKSIKHVTFYIDNERLKEIELINTPGMNVLTEDFYPKVQHLFAEADIILWVNSSEQILDNYNSWLIQKIHADNDKIVGLITFPDKLYRQDENSGVTDVVSQFMSKLENDRLIRVDGKIGLFILNGKFAQIAFSHKENLKFINDLEYLDEEEDKLKMIYNFLHHSFAYSDEENNIEILRKYNLYGIVNIQTPLLSDEFELEGFYNFCLEQGICELNENSTSALYTKKGRELLGEVSQYNSFGRFSEDYLIPLSKESKYNSVYSRLNRILSTSDNKDNSISRLIQIKDNLASEKDKLGSEEKDRLNAFEGIITILKSEYNNWYKKQIGFQTDTYSDDLIDFISKKIDEDIGGYDFFKEILGTLTPKILKGNTETTISKKISEIIEEGIEIILPKSINNLAEEANTQIEYIMIKMQKDYLSKKNVDANIKGNYDSDITPNIDTSKILKHLQKHLKPILKKMIIRLMKNLAKKDLRKGANTWMKKNIIKPIVILIRKLLQKEAKKVAVKKVAQAGAKSGMGPFGWVLAMLDIISIGKDLRDMYIEMKASLKETLKNEKSFGNIFEEEAIRVYTIILDEVVKELNSNFSKDKKDKKYILDGIEGCDNVLLELDKFKNI
ncbi:dynamin family protein [Lentimicrobium sp. S6]|uniref:dynamin family protein n=1 Tax=Lentimicrobium sp. S6 TaxID=2735872 RepID=UPI001553338E|nr:dynamin family protein [Lentimicrobium sp. S6]NPD46903.1 hypothetical protein [Lentimicrobium sp. S6]